MGRALEPLGISDPNSIEDWFERFEFYVTKNEKTDLRFFLKETYKLLKEMFSRETVRSFDVRDKELFIEQFVTGLN